MKVFDPLKNINWKKIDANDLKARLKLVLRSIAYSAVVQNIICTIIAGYMWLVYLSSKKNFINSEKFLESTKNRKPLVVVFWHNRLMMMPFITLKPKKLNSGYNFMTLASRHGDGRIVGRVMEKFGLISILGSTKSNKKSDRGIPVSSFKQIFNGLKAGYSIGITPDGPRGPNQKVNGEIVNIARISGAGILAISYSASRFIELKTWDKFKIPLPFSRLNFAFDREIIYVDRSTTEEEAQQIKANLEDRLNQIQRESEEF